MVHAGRCAGMAAQHRPAFRNVDVVRPIVSHQHRVRRPQRRDDARAGGEDRERGIKPGKDIVIVTIDSWKPNTMCQGRLPAVNGVVGA